MHPAYHDLAVLRLAELDYFEQQFDSSSAKLNRIAVNVNADVANDALQLSYFIDENKQSAPAALKDFSQAHLLMRQRKYSESLAGFQSVVKTYPSAYLVDDALLNIGELNVLLKRYADAAAAFHTIADSMQTSILKDRAQFRLAEMFERTTHEGPKAIDAYEQLLVKFPNSMFAEETRKRIRLLRGDAL